jgi:hypothetical protein
VRTLPNDSGKQRRRYQETDPPAYFTIEAIEFINQLAVDHLLVDLPSLDRMRDEGLLTCHHIFWGVQENTHKLAASARSDKSITEMIFVPDEIPDGFYLLNLQVCAFSCDAAPSRPVLFKLREIP